MRAALRLAGRHALLRHNYRQLLRSYCDVVQQLTGAREELRRVRADAECLALMVPDRQVALALVRDRRRIDRLEETGGQITEETG